MNQAIENAIYLSLKTLYIISLVGVVLFWIAVQIFGYTQERLVETNSNEQYVIDVYLSYRGAMTEDGFSIYLNDEKDFWPFPTWVYGNEVAGDSASITFVGLDSSWVDFYNRGNQLHSDVVMLDLIKGSSVKLHPHDLLRPRGKGK